MTQQKPQNVPDRLLAMDTVAGACSVAVSDGDSLLAHLYEPMMRGHAENLLPMVEQALGEAGMTPADLDGVAVTIGPGAFTGLRIGLSAARAYAVARKIPVIGVTSFEAMVEAVRVLYPDNNAPILTVLDAKRSDVYAQLFNPDGTPRDEARAVLPETLAQQMAEHDGLCLCGDMIEQLSPLLGENNRLSAVKVVTPDACYVTTVARRKGIVSPYVPPAPLYIRPPDAKLPQNGGRLRP